MYDELVKRLRMRARLFKQINQMENCIMDEAADAIEKLSKPKWIPVTERLPDEPGFYIVYTDSSYNPIRMLRYGMAAPVSFRNGNNWYDEKGQQIYSWLVKFWMPLPEPPKEE